MGPILVLAGRVQREALPGSVREAPLTLGNDEDVTSIDYAKYPVDCLDVRVPGQPSLHGRPGPRRYIRSLMPALTSLQLTG